MLCMALSDRLKQPLEEVLSTPLDTVYLWAAYFALVDEKKEK